MGIFKLFISCLVNLIKTLPKELYLHYKNQIIWYNEIQKLKGERIDFSKKK